jgi:hypothetical protein
MYYRMPIRPVLTRQQVTFDIIDRTSIFVISFFVDIQCYRMDLVDVLVHFYCDRLSDETCVPKLLEGIDALVTFDNFIGKNAMTVAKM